MLFFNCDDDGASSEPICESICRIDISASCHLHRFLRGAGEYLSKLNNTAGGGLSASAGVEQLTMVVASSIGADLAMAFSDADKTLPWTRLTAGGSHRNRKGRARYHVRRVLFAIKAYWDFRRACKIIRMGTIRTTATVRDGALSEYIIQCVQSVSATDRRVQAPENPEDSELPIGKCHSAFWSLVW